MVLVFVDLFGFQMVVVDFLVYAGRYLVLFAGRLVDAALRIRLG